MADFHRIAIVNRGEAAMRLIKTQMIYGPYMPLPM